MTKQEKEKLEQLLQSKNLDDVNLAGVLIKEKLKLTDETLKLLYSFIELAFNKQYPNNSTVLTKFEFMRQLLQGDIHEPELNSIFQYPWTTNPPIYFGTDPYKTTINTIPGDTTINYPGIITYTNDSTTT